MMESSASVPEIPQFHPIDDFFDITKACNYRLIHAQRSSILFIASIAYRKITSGRRMKVVHALDHSCYCSDMIPTTPLPENFAATLIAEMENLCKDTAPIEMISVRKSDLLAYFTQLQFTDKIHVLSQLSYEEIHCVKYKDSIDLGYNSQYIRDLSKVGSFDVQVCDGGFFLRFPALLAKGTVKPWKGPPLQHRLLHRFGLWARQVRSDSLEDLNKIVIDDKVKQLNAECDKFNRTSLSDIAQSLVSDFNNRRVIAISGPSSSGKSTFSATLSAELENTGHKCLVMSMDNYIVDRVLTPLDEDGKYDFESIYSLHLDMMKTHIHALLRGESVPKRRYDFVKGEGYDVAGESITLAPTEFLVIEGINGINPVLLEMIGNNLVTKILVYPMTPITIDGEHCFLQSDLMQLRRIIRDFDERGFSPRTNVAWWPDVCVGEARNITPNLREVDLFYNSSLIYELSVLSSVGIPLLRKGLEMPKEEDPQIAQEVDAELKRLLGLLELFSSIPAKKVPKSSCLYKFVRGKQE